MKKTLITLALLSAFAASAQTTVDSTSGSNSNSGAASQSGAAVNASNSGNVSAVGNENASRSNSASQSGAQSGSLSGAVGNAIYLDQSGPSSQTVNQTVNGSTTSTNHTTVDGKTTNDQNVKYSGVVENRSSGGTYDRVDTNVHYSGTQTLKNVPSIAMSGPASGPCTGQSGGIGISGPGWGVGLNGSSVMDDCRMRENTRVLGMGMQSLDGAANPQEKGEATVMFMDAMRNLAAYNNTIYQRVAKEAK
jgi:hypothetical protein